MKIRKVSGGETPPDLDNQVDLLLASEFGYLDNDPNGFWDYEGQEDDWRDTPEY